MHNLKSFFDAFYNRLILRDFFGKVIPGLILISVITICVGLQFNKLSELVRIIHEISLWVWLVMFGLAWITAFAIQSFGESIPKNRHKRLIIYYPTDSFSNDEKWYEFYNRFIRKASDDEKMQVERLVVIKEACGNGYVSLILALYFVAIYAFVGLILRIFWGEHNANLTLFTLGNLQIIFPGLALWIYMICYLKKMHIIHVNRQYQYMKEVLSNKTE